MSSTPAPSPNPSKHKSPIRWGHYLQNVVLWAAVIVIFGPIFWLIVTSFKTNAAAYALPPKIIFTPTLEQYTSALQDFWPPFFNSVVIVGASTIISLVLGVPAAFALSFYSSKRNEGIVFWFITTKALPQVAVLVPLFIIFRDAATSRHGLGTHHSFRRHEHADSGLDDVPVHEGHPKGYPGGGAGGWGEPFSDAIPDSDTAHPRRHRLDGYALRDLRLERVSFQCLVHVR